ncbi:MAG: hypothetical protein C0502_01510 [Opitutus sp.]|nr:hypothetical protein [Opitutus sp.]
MKKKLLVDGSKDLASQENAIRNKEADGYEMTDMGKDAKPDNWVELKRLPVGQVPKRLKLHAGPPGSGHAAFWKGRIFISGKEDESFATRA